MTSRNGAYLFQLIPALYRVRDADRGGPLQALLEVIGPELDRIEHDIAGLYDNWFIETCDEWVVPYIGDLLGVRPIRSIPEAGVSTRAYVANTLAYRRRKGTAFVLEQLARDTTGWPAHAVEFFKLLETTQNLNHVRLKPQAAPSVRDAARAELPGTAFDEFAHLPEMRRAASGRGRYNVQNIGLYLWRLQAYPLDRVTARRLAAIAANTFAFHPAGVDTPLFNAVTAETDITQLSAEQNVPGQLRRLAINREFEQARAGNLGSLRFMNSESPAFRILVELGGSGSLVEVPVSQMYTCDIPDSVESASPAPLAVAIDLARGRMRFPAALVIHRVLVSYLYGFPGDVGGGPYDRRDSAQQALFVAEKCDWQAGVSHTGEIALPPAQIFPDLSAAVAAWNVLPAGRTGVISIMDNESDAGAIVAVEIKEGSNLLIISADWPQREDFTRPFGTFVPESLRSHLIGDVSVRGTAPAGSQEPGSLFINGLLIEGSLGVENGNLGSLTLQHSTLLGPLRVFSGNDRLSVNVDRSLVVGISVGAPILGVELVDSIVTAGVGSPSYAILAASTPCSIDSSTLVGEVTVQSLFASNCLFNDPVTAIRRQTGCVRFSYLPPDSIAPRRYRCQPDLAIQNGIDEARIRPLFVSLKYGDAQFGQLDGRCPPELRTGAEDGSEMGAYRFLQQPQRESNLRTVLLEYLRFGLEARLFYVT